MASYFEGRTASPSRDTSSPGSPATQGAAGRSTALSSRITSVLSASYSDLDIRDALETLDARGILNSQETRRNLRLDVQREIIECNGEIVKDFGQVAEQLKRVGTAITNLNKCCADMRAQINASNQESQPMLDEASTLLKQKTEVESKQRILEAFKSHFVISEDDATSLTSTAEPVNDQFFHILTRVKKIHSDSQILLGSENQQLGLEILDQSSRQLNGGYQKLYRWIQREFKNLDLENPQINASVRRSIRVLAERPTLFQSCLDSFAEAREHNLSDSFYTALTGTSSNNQNMPSTKPIEFQAHDPLRYVSDMLAWAHSATVSEREALEVLFISEGDEIAKSIQEGLESEPWSREEGQEVFDGKKALNELVSRDLAGVARLLRQRTEQVIHSHEDATLAYKIANLLTFYRGTLVKLLGDQSEVLDVLMGLEESAMRQFRASMRDHVAAVQNDLAVAPHNLAPPEFLEEALNMLRQLLKDYDASLAAVDTGAYGFQPVFVEGLDPFLGGCESIYKTLTEPNNDVFAINCLLQTRVVLVPFSFAKDRVIEIDGTIQKHISNLIKHQHRFFLDYSGLNSLLLALGELTANSAEALSTIETLPPFKAESLIRISHQLDEFLPSALIDAMGNVKRLRDTKLVQNITEEAAEKFCEDFEFVEGKVMEADDAKDKVGAGDEGTPKLRELFPRTSGEIRVLLS